MDPHPTYNAQRPTGIPAIPTWRPMIEWRWSARVCLDNINVYPLGDPSSPVAGPGMVGHCSVAGVWYDGDSFPENYRNSFYFSDFNNKWVRNLRFDSNNIALEAQITGGIAKQYAGCRSLLGSGIAVRDSTARPARGDFRQSAVSRFESLVGGRPRDVLFRNRIGQLLPAQGRRKLRSLGGRR